jgi:hypothetical protein
VSPARSGSAVKDSFGDRGSTKIRDSDRIEVGQETVDSLANARFDDFLKQLGRSAYFDWVGGAQGHHYLYDFADGDLARFARGLVAAERPAHALQNVSLNEPLQQRFQSAGRQIVTKAVTSDSRA